MTEPPAGRGGVLVSDFDGTLTHHDFYRLALAHLVPAGVPDYWAEYRSGRLSHFETLRAYFSAIRAGEGEVRDLVRTMGLDPETPELVRRLRARGWEVVVASAGCDWYIRQVLAAAGLEVTVHANPGRFVPGEGLLMSAPLDSPYYCRDLGVDKAGIVRAALAAGGPVAFAGDGFPDAAAARLVPPELRFARADLVTALRAEGLPFREFDRWPEVARALLSL